MALDSSSEAFSKYLKDAVEKVKETLGGGGVAILVPPGSARDKVVVELVKKGVVGGHGEERAKGEVLLYEDLRSRVERLLYEEFHKEVKVGKFLRFENGQYVVEEGGKMPLLQYLKSGTTQEYAPKQSKVVIVPRDTTEAITIYALLSKALEEEKRRANSGEEELVKVLFLPAFYKEGDGEVAELAKVDYGHVLKGVVEEAEGVSPSLARLAKEYKAGGRLDELRWDVELLRSLYAGWAAPGLLAIVRDAAASAARSTGLSWVSSAATSAVLSYVLTALAFLNPLGAIAYQLLGGFIKGVLDRVISRLKKRKDETLAAIIELAKRAKEAKPLVEEAVKSKGGGGAGKAPPATLEALVDWVAASWGLTMQEFATVVHNLATVLEGKIATHGDVEELKARWAELERRVERLEEWKKAQEVRGLLEAGLAKVYLAPEDWAEVLYEAGGVLKLREGLLVGVEGVELVETGLVEAVVEELMGGGRIVVVKGRKGIGKTTATIAALYKLLKGVMDGLVPAVVELHLAHGVEAYLSQLPRIVKKVNEDGVFPIFYLDPSKALAYEWATAGEHRPEPLSVFVKALSDLSKAPLFGKAAVVVVVSDDQYEVVKRVLESLRKGGYVREIDADVVLGGGKVAFVKALVEKYSGCKGEVVERVAGAVASFADNYAVAAVVAAYWLSGKCRSEEVEKAVERARGNVFRFILDYLWHGLFKGSDAVASQYAPLLLAVGFFGPHPPKLAKAVIRAFGNEPDDTVIRWFSQPLHGTLYEVIEKVAHGAVFRRFGVGSDELCQGSKEGPCSLVEICSEKLVMLEAYDDILKVMKEYAKRLAKALDTAGYGGTRAIDLLIGDFLAAYKKAVDRLEGVKFDKLDILATLYGLATLSGWYDWLEPLKDWLFVGDKKFEVASLYISPLLRERGRELVERAVAITEGMEKRKAYTDVDLWRAVGIIANGDWAVASNEQLEKAVRLVAYMLSKFAIYSSIIFYDSSSLFVETWHRIEGGRATERLADQLALVAYNIFGVQFPSTLNLFELEGVDSATIVKRFNVLYKTASNAGRLLLLDMLFLSLYIPECWYEWATAADMLPLILLGKTCHEPENALAEVARWVANFVSSLRNDVELMYAKAWLYPRLILGRSQFSCLEFAEAEEYIENMLSVLNELKNAVTNSREEVERALKPYLELKYIKPDLDKELNELHQHVYYHIARVYMNAGKLEEAAKYAQMVYMLAKNLGDLCYEVLARSLLLRIETIRGGVPPIEEFEEQWLRASQNLPMLSGEIIATILGEYVLALVSARRLGDAEEALKRGVWALEAYPEVMTLTYGVLSLFDERYLAVFDKSLEIYEITTGALEVFIKALETIVTGASGVVYSEENVKALAEMATRPNVLFLSALIGLIYCKRGEGRGLDLARAAALIGSLLCKSCKGLVNSLFGELASALKNVGVGNCTMEDVLKAVHKLYYLHVWPYLMQFSEFSLGARWSLKGA